MRLLKLCMVPVLLGGCPEDMNQYVPTPGGYAAQIDGYVGQDVTALTSRFGAPTQTDVLPPDRMLYTWEDRSEMHTSQRGRTQTNSRTGEQTLVITGGDRIPFDCKTEATVNASGTIIATRTEGYGCLGLAPADAPSGRSAAPANLSASNASPIPAVAPAPVVIQPLGLPKSTDATSQPLQPRIAPSAAPQPAPNPAMVRPATETRRERRRRLRK